MSEPEIKLIDDYEGEWQQLFIDGELVAENHRIGLDYALKKIFDNLQICTYVHEVNNTEG
jgi:hypothetical protein